MGKQLVGSGGPVRRGCRTNIGAGRSTLRVLACLQPGGRPWSFKVSETPLEAPPTVYVVTPTYRRPTQAPDLLRVSQSLMLSTNVFWVVVEDATRRSELVASIVAGSGLPSVHLLGPCPKEHRKPSSGRGAAGRRRALQWLRQNASLPGVLYFADDDNTYDFRLFDEIRWVRKVGVLPVGLVGRFGVSSPVVVAGRVVGFHDSFDSGRTFPVDMAGFAVNLRLVLDGQPDMPYVLGMQETRFLESLNVTTAQLEPLARNCTQAGPGSGVAHEIGAFNLPQTRAC
ncbi:galactosylgalactosylxylosylprotein 3-beta-glucuronosyltransferase 2 [Ixodes scapularis]|uniref:galactosylgalactosylxylosylprotein 3-beta-glucuronosyltransferase 2 n=1 Tax=Ixodes scapularis TaxID=6945 RepID=UPI001C389733|nr:galactosylgalactosylxylosylprotein 3-beta-glucuronosyltransferase 2 [Ixodes scapularis]